jgi:two-component system chemotaxis response regulator CheY
VEPSESAPPALNTKEKGIMVTAEADKGRVVLAIQADVTDHLLKPFTPDALGEKLVKHG